MPLTDTACRNAKPTEKPRKLADSGGLYLLVKPMGKYWRWDYRHEGKRKTMALGVYPDVGLQQARERTQAARTCLADGADPMQHRAAEKIAAKTRATNSLQSVASDWLQHQSGRWTAETKARALASLEADVYPVLGSRAIEEISPSEVMAIIKGIESRGASETAGRVLQRIKSVYRYAVTHERIERNPMLDLVPSDILKPRRVQHRPALAAAELPTFLEKLAAYDGDPHTVHALQLLMLTAVRPGEVRGALWSEFDLMAAQWRIPAERMKMRAPHVVPLSRQAVAVLEAMQPLSGTRALVFPSPYYPSKPLSENTLNSAMARMGYKNTATAHGFRALFSTVANEAGWAPDVIERQLAHVERNQVRAAYNRSTYLQDRQRLVQWWADYLDRCKGGNVIPLRPKAA